MSSPYAAHVIWICGLSGAGKSTLASALARGLRAASIPVLELDGDTLRGGLCEGLGFTDGDRTENIRRAAEIARLALHSRLCVAASLITPLESQRELVRSIISRDHLSLIWANASLDVCCRRDVKGLYAKCRAGRVEHMTGFAGAFEKPNSPDVVLNTGTETLAESTRILLDFALRRLRGWPGGKIAQELYLGSPRPNMTTD